MVKLITACPICGTKPKVTRHGWSWLYVLAGMIIGCDRCWGNNAKP